MNNNDKLSIYLIILSNVLPPIGFYLFYRYRIQFPRKAKTALLNGIIGVPIGIIGGYILENYILI